MWGGGEGGAGWGGGRWGGNGGGGGRVDVCVGRGGMGCMDVGVAVKRWDKKLKINGEKL